MQLSHAINKLETAVETQLAVADPDIAAAGGQLMAALKPAISQTMMDVVSLAVAEISSQLDGQTIDIKLVDGDPELVVSEDPASVAPPRPPHRDGDDEDEARITVRLPGYLKDLISSEAENAGDSVNSYVVDVLSSKARRSRGRAGTRQRTTIDL
ncbi:MAG: hypothetical protein PVF87_10015 [Acidimicrobiia bacterium]|jgi:hypothetical protein